MDNEEDKIAQARSPGEFAAARQAQFPAYFPPMLASLADAPFSRAGWIYEPKLDGMRCIAYVDGDKVKLLSRRGQNITSQYPALANALPGLCKCRLVIDGEIIALNEEGKPSFQLLQKRMNLLKVSDIARADARIPVHYFVFDIVYAGNCSVAACKLTERKLILKQSLEEAQNLILLAHFEEDGKIAYEACIENGFEGIVAKRKESPYESGRRSPYWVKVKAQKSSEFIIGGYSMGQGSRASTFGSLLLGYHDQENSLIYAGSVGSGFDERLLADLMRRMNPLKATTCPFLQKPEDKKDAIWLRPEMVAEIKFMDWTEDRHLRNPVFLHLRYDILPAEVRLIAPISQAQIQALTINTVPSASPQASPNTSSQTAAKTSSEAGAQTSLNAGSKVSPKSSQKNPPPIAKVPEERTSHCLEHENLKETNPDYENPDHENSNHENSDHENLNDDSPKQGNTDSDFQDKIFESNRKNKKQADRVSEKTGPKELRSTTHETQQVFESQIASMNRTSDSADSPKESGIELEIRHWKHEAQSIIAQLGGKERTCMLSADHETISLTNLDKILFPATDSTRAVTKREFLKLIAFLSPYILTHLHHRPLTMIRAPSGMRSRSFYQKHWNLDIPDFIETIRTPASDPTRKDQLLCNNIAALIYLAQHNILEYHCWLSRTDAEAKLDGTEWTDENTPGHKASPRAQAARNAESESREDACLTMLEYPDYMVFDIDIHKDEKADGDLDRAAFDKAAQVAIYLKEILEQIGLRSYLKTSGRNGLHIFIPIIRELNFDQVRTLAETIARHLERQYPELISTSAVAARKSFKVFLDYQANTRGKTIATAYTPRLTSKTTISTPIEWSELGSVYPDQLTLHNIQKRISNLGDIWKDILNSAEDLSLRFDSKPNG